MSYNKALFKQMVEESKKKKSLPKPKDKILDPMGQWKFPGQVTRIPSNRITMQGVPYPVKGVGSTGQEQMMYQGQEYSFPGSQYVDEYPLVKAQKGLTFLEPNSQKLPVNNNRSELATSIGGENGEPAFLVPSFKYGRPILGPSNNLYDEFYRTGEHLGGPFKIWQEADEWDRNVRHPYVEKGQSIPIPIRRWGRDYNNQSSGERNSFFFKNGGDISIPDLEEGGWLGRYQVGGQLPKFQTAGQNDFFNRMMKRASANQYNNAPSFSDVQDRGMSANVKASYQPQIKKQQALTTIQKKTGVNRNIAGILDYLQTSPGSTATISQGRQRTQRDEEERKRRNYEYAMNNGLLYNHNTGDVANPNDKGATGGGWGRVEAPELAQTFAGMSGSGNIGAGRIGAEMFTNMNPITAPITSAGRLTQQVLGQNPYGFNNNGFISNILPALGVAGDIAGVSSFKLLPGSQRVINQGNRILNYGNRSYGPGQTPVLRSSMVPSGKQVKKVIDNINQKTNNTINWLGKELSGAKTFDYTGKSGKNYKIEYRNSNNLGKDLEFKRFFDISHADDASQHFGFTISKPKGKIASLDDLAFFNNDPDAANEQLGLFLRGIENSALTIPLTKINNRGMMPFGSQNLSMYSQPMMNIHASRLARQMGQSGPRLQLLYDNTAPLKELNSSIRTAPGSSTFRDQLLEMWPKIESSYKLLQENTGIKMKRPRLLYNDFEDMFNFGQTNDINVDMLKQSKYRGLQPGNVNMLVPEYGIIKNYKQGGQINWLDKYK